MKQFLFIFAVVLFAACGSETSSTSSCDSCSVDSTCKDSICLDSIGVRQIIQMDSLHKEGKL